MVTGGAGDNISSAHAASPVLALSVVVPCFDEAPVLAALHGRLSSACKACVGDSYEIVLVNDGSADATWEIMKVLASQDGHVVVADLARNHGHQLALSAGLSLTRGDRILVMDADLQDPPELLSDMMESMDAGADVVYGKRTARDGESFFKRTSARLFYRLLAGLVDVDIPLDAGDFRLMSRRVLNVLLSMPEQHRFFRGMVTWIGFKQVAIPYKRHPRFAGQTKYTLRKMLVFGADAVTGFSIQPLRLSLYLSAGFMVLALILGVGALVAWANAIVIPGWTSLFLAMLVFFSVQLASLAIIGEYVGRIYAQTKNRPLYVIREVRTQYELPNGMTSDAQEKSRSALTVDTL